MCECVRHHHLITEGRMCFTHHPTFASIRLSDLCATELPSPPVRPIQHDALDTSLHVGHGSHTHRCSTLCRPLSRASGASRPPRSTRGEIWLQTVFLCVAATRAWPGLTRRVPSVAVRSSRVLCRRRWPDCPQSRWKPINFAISTCQSARSRCDGEFSSLGCAPSAASSSQPTVVD